MADRKRPEEKTTWLDKPRNIAKIWYGLIALCAVFVLSDFFYHKHVKYSVEDLIPGMYGWYGLASCAILVFGAKVLQIVVRRKEDYYDEAGDD